MARQRKFPIPTTIKEIPYDKEGFIKWCIGHQNLAESSAKQYADEVKTAYLMLFDENDTLFDDIKTAFIPKPLEMVSEKYRPYIEERSLLFDKISEIEDEYVRLMGYCSEIENINENDVINTSEGIEMQIPKEKWLRAFNAYARYIKWRIVKIYEENCVPPLLATIPPLNTPPITNKDFFDFPLKKEFMVYLRKLHKKQDPNWKPKSEKRIKELRPNTYQGEAADYSYITRLTKLYNLIIVRRINLETLNNLKTSLQRKKRPFFSKIYNRLSRYITLDRQNYPDGVISDQDIYYGCKALEQYFYFMKEYSENPLDYVPITYSRKSKSK